MGSYKFKLIIENSTEEEISREIQINKEDTFEELYLAVMYAFEFNGDQMASFYVLDENKERGDEITLMDMGTKAKLMPDVFLNELVEKGNKNFTLVYDFLQMWTFDISCIGEVKKATDIAVITKKVGEAPNEQDKEINVDNLDNFDLGEEAPAAPKEKTKQDEIDDIMNEYSDDVSDSRFTSLDELDESEDKNYY